MSRRSGGGLGGISNIKEPLVFSKYALYLWTALCIMAGVGIISLVLIWLISFGGS